MQHPFVPKPDKPHVWGIHTASDAQYMWSSHCLNRHIFCLHIFIMYEPEPWKIPWSFSHTGSVRTCKTHPVVPFSQHRGCTYQEPGRIPVGISDIQWLYICIKSDWKSTFVTCTQLLFGYTHYKASTYKVTLSQCFFSLPPATAVTFRRTVLGTWLTVEQLTLRIEPFCISHRP